MIQVGMFIILGAVIAQMYWNETVFNAVNDSENFEKELDELSRAAKDDWVNNFYGACPAGEPWHDWDSVIFGDMPMVVCSQCQLSIPDLRQTLGR